MRRTISEICNYVNKMLVGQRHSQSGLQVSCVKSPRFELQWGKVQSYIQCARSESRSTWSARQQAYYE